MSAPDRFDTFDTFGFALAAAVLQSDLYHTLDDRQRAECDELIARGFRAPEDAAPSEPVALFDCEIKPRALSYPLKDYHTAMSSGPLHYTWQDKPHRLVYDLIAAVRYYAAPQPDRLRAALLDARNYI